MENGPPSVLLIGDAEHHELRPAKRWLQSHVRLQLADSVAQVLALAPPYVADWQTIVLAQTRPGQFSLRDVERLSHIVPLAHFVALLGSHCEGETRSGQPWPGVVRVYWHQWLVRCEAELVSRIEPTSWQLPRTSSEVERTQCLLQRAAARHDGLLAIYTRKAVLFDALAAACRRVGYTSVWCVREQRRIVEGAVAAIWDAETADEASVQQLARITRHLGTTPVVAVMGFPRFDQVQRLLSSGVASVVSLPLQLPDLWTALRQAIESSPGVAQPVAVTVPDPASPARNIE